MGPSPAVSNALCPWARHLTSIAPLHPGDMGSCKVDITLEVLIGLLRLKRLHAQVMRHDSDESSVPANLVPFGSKPSGFNGHPVCLFCI